MTDCNEAKREKIGNLLVRNVVLYNEVAALCNKPSVGICADTSITEQEESEFLWSDVVAYIIVIVGMVSMTAHGIEIINYLIRWSVNAT